MSAVDSITWRSLSLPTNAVHSTSTLAESMVSILMNKSDNKILIHSWTVQRHSIDDLVGRKVQEIDYSCAYSLAARLTVLHRRLLSGWQTRAKYDVKVALMTTTRRHVFYWPTV